MTSASRGGTESVTHRTGDPLLDMHPGDGPGNDQTLDLAGPFEDGVDLRVTVPTLHRVLADVAVAAHDLDGLFGDVHRRLAGVELGHGTFTGGELLAVATHPRGPPHQQPRCVDPRLHVRQFEGNGLMLDDGPTECLALLGVLERVLVGGPGNAESLSSHRRTGGLERLHGRLAG